jgi:hypothetical protein
VEEAVVLLKSLRLVVEGEHLDDREYLVVSKIYLE